MGNDALIVEAGRRLREAVPEARVFLFGSQARGDAQPSSDIDILVVESEVDNAAEESVRLMRLLSDMRVPIDLVVVSQGYADQWRGVRGHFVHTALAEARELGA